MANETKLTITIDANGNKAIQVLEKTEKRAASFTKKVKDNWLAITAGAVAAQQIISRALDMARFADRYDQNRRSFKLMVEAMGKDADQEFKKIQEASGGLIDKNALTESANRAISLGLNIDKLGLLMQVARAKARDMGITTTQAFSDIATGIGRGSVMILDNLGITIKLGEANQAYADSIKKTVSELTAYDKQQAITNAVIEAGTEAIERQDLSIRTNAERWQAWEASITNAKLAIGGFINRIAIGITGVLQFLSAGLLGVAEFVIDVVHTFQSIGLSIVSTLLELSVPMLDILATAAKVTDALGLTENAAEAVSQVSIDAAKSAEDYAKESSKVAAEVEKAGDAWLAAEELTGKAADNIMLMVQSQKELDKAQKAAGPPRVPGAIGDDKNIQERLDLIREMEARVAEIGLEADALALLRLDEKHDAELEKFQELNAKKNELAQAEMLQLQEREALITEIEKSELDKRLKAQERAANDEKSIRASVISNTVSLLSQLGQQSKAAALAAIILSKGQAISQTIQFGAAAQIRALAELGPIAGTAAAARIKFWTGANVALIAATGLGQAAGLGGGGGGGGGGGAGVATPPAVPERAQESRQPRITVQIFNSGSVVTEGELSRQVFDNIQKLQEDGLPSNTSR